VQNQQHQKQVFHAASLYCESELIDCGKDDLLRNKNLSNKKDNCLKRSGADCRVGGRIKRLNLLHSCDMLFGIDAEKITHRYA
jgi:hypothetical protein